MIYDIMVYGGAVLAISALVALLVGVAADTPEAPLPPDEDARCELCFVRVDDPRSRLCPYCADEMYGGMGGRIR
ncbi:hypothetical protein HS125_20575 [bacterium]|nr:hypothetical protein [bacterium]